MARFLRRAFVLVVLGYATVAWAAPKGTMVLTDHEIDPKAPGFEKALKHAAKSSIVKAGDGWPIYFVAYLKKPAGAPEVNLVFYEMAGGKREQVNVFPIATQATAEILASNVTILPEQGFKAGKRYDVLLTRLIGGREDVYAKASVVLR